MGKPKILFLPDNKGWIHDFKAHNIKNNLEYKYDIDIMYLHGLPKIDHGKYDAIITFSWRHLDRLDYIPKNKLASAVTSHQSFFGVPYDMQLELLNKAICIAPLNYEIMVKVKDMHKNIFYAPNGVDCDMFKPNYKIPSDPLVLGWAGSFKHDLDKKGVTEFIIPAVRKAGVELNIAGAHENNTKNVSLPREEMVKFYDDIDIYINTPKFDAVPNGVLEAAACGKPIISTNVGIAPELLTHKLNSYIAERNIKDIADGIEFFKNNKTLIDVFGRKLRKTITKWWSWKDRSYVYDRIFEFIIGENK